MGPGVVPPAGWERRRQRHVGSGHRQEHTVPAGGARDGQFLCKAQTGRELIGEVVEARVGEDWGIFEKGWVIKDGGERESWSVSLGSDISLCNALISSPLLPTMKDQLHVADSKEPLTFMGTRLVVFACLCIEDKQRDARFPLTVTHR